ncbi:glycogen/starch/alpha-glucan family phosphorylase [Christensenellaceae bacterium OttesenSCG-928-K19]|nr:glycogen/starch/alpha-glucan family phosphorylase [Christensenellaceae bacterium OttesenSCG-928-K19]
MEDSRKIKKEEENRKHRVIERIEEIIRIEFLKKLPEANAKELEFAVARAVSEMVAPGWREGYFSKERKAYYFSAEYLIGRMVYHNLHALGVIREIEELLQERGVDFAGMQDVEAAVIGNGGLGRLAACFMDSAAVMEVPMIGYGIKYRYGLFYQKIENGFQVEVVDDWKSDTNPWFYRREADSVLVSFAGQTVRAVPYDMPVIGYRSNRVNNLRLWQAQALQEFDFQRFNDGDYYGAVEERFQAEMITYVLYPNDSTEEGKRLRLKQQYFFSSASLQDMLNRYWQKYETEDMEQFVETTAVQLNDTHPVVAIPEFIRLMMNRGIAFEDAFLMAQDIFSYTNHTIMAEALERWDKRIFKSLLPDVYAVIKKINKRLLKEFDGSEDIGELEIIHNGEIHMARLAIYCSSYVNGVAQIHTDILKNREMKAWYKHYPDRFQNKTNGVAQRRWVALSNREFAALITEKIGDGWIRDFSQISRIEPYIGDDEFVRRFGEVKHARKMKLAEYIKKRDGFYVNPNTVFDIQIKRLHEYKRQLLNAFAIMDLYFRMKEGGLQDLPPITFIFGSKAAPGYYIAKSIIKYINEVARIIAQDSEVNGRMAVYFVSNYDVPYAEKLFPAADISEQISTAGTEASGTGNMKFMMNGAVTLGTYDGANVEIFEQAGEGNNYVFGARVEELEEMGDKYNPRKVYKSNPRLKRVVDTLVDGTLSDNGTGMFQALYDSLLSKDRGAAADQYKVLLDFEDYTKKKLEVLSDCRDSMAFWRKCLYNVARSGKFSSDRCILEYADDIWRVSSKRPNE